jgi:hypothetical protein
MGRPNRSVWSHTGLFLLPKEEENMINKSTEFLLDAGMNVGLERNTVTRLMFMS